MMKREASVRIQTSVLNGVEKKVLVWLAQRQPRWMTSDILTFIGTAGAIIVAAGFILAGTKNIGYLWAGLSGMVHFPLAMSILVVYLMLTINVSVNAHLKKEFRLTYAKLGPTEFRIIMIAVNTVLMYVAPVREFSWMASVAGREITFSALDTVALAILVILVLIYLVTVIRDAMEYDRLDPMPEPDGEKTETTSSEQMR